MSGILLVAAIYVDDILVTGNNEILRGEYKAEILKEFDMTDLCLMSYWDGGEARSWWSFHKLKEICKWNP